ncbi:MAG: glycosyltransferase family 2 protein [Caldiserica bacterium]|nr:glycosyltransferase family 2 protein [Caldisericota bacterium]
MKISLIIPAYNEGTCLLHTLKKVKDYFREKPWESEIIVVNDGSQDNTGEIAKKEKVKTLNNPLNKGKGFSVKRGIETAEGDYIFFTDADLSTPIEEIDKFVACLDEGYDLAIGSRAHPESKILRRQAKQREIMGKFFNLLVKILFRLPYRDTQCGFKGFRREAAKKLFSQLKCEGFAFDVEIILKARAAGYSIKEIGVTWINAPDSKVKLFSSPFSMLREILKLKLSRNF